MILWWFGIQELTTIQRWQFVYIVSNDGFWNEVYICMYLFDSKRMNANMTDENNVRQFLFFYCRVLENLPQQNDRHSCIKCLMKIILQTWVEEKLFRFISSNWQTAQWNRKHWKFLDGFDIGLEGVSLCYDVHLWEFGVFTVSLFLFVIISSSTSHKKIVFHFNSVISFYFPFIQLSFISLPFPIYNLLLRIFYILCISTTIQHFIKGLGGKKSEMPPPPPPPRRNGHHAYSEMNVQPARSSRNWYLPPKASLFFRSSVSFFDVTKECVNNEMTRAAREPREDVIEGKGRREKASHIINEDSDLDNTRRKWPNL